MQGDNPSYSAGNIALMLKQGPEGSTIFFTRERWKPQGLTSFPKTKCCKYSFQSLPSSGVQADT